MAVVVWLVVAVVAGKSDWYTTALVRFVIWSLLGLRIRGCGDTKVRGYKDV